MRIAVITDVHANLPALQAFSDQVQVDTYDRVIHLGDAIAIGPYPRECLEMLMGFKNIQFVLGNHDDWYAHGLPQVRPGWMTEGELAHQGWTHAQLGDGYRDEIKSWPWIISDKIQGIELSFLHYALEADGKSFKGIKHDLTAEDCDGMFDLHADYVFYGHTHKPSDLLGRARYLTPGSFGCQVNATAPYLHLEIIDGELDVAFRHVTYDDKILFEAFETQRVPERGFIYQAFFGGRFIPTAGDV